MLCIRSFDVRCSFVRSFVLFVRSFVRSFLSSSLRSLLPELCSSLRSLVRSLVRSFVRSFVCSFAPSLLRSFVRSFVCSFVRLFIQRSLLSLQSVASWFARGIAVSFSRLLIQPLGRSGFVRSFVRSFIHCKLFAVLVVVPCDWIWRPMLFCRSSCCVAVRSALLDVRLTKCRASFRCRLFVTGCSLVAPQGLFVVSASVWEVHRSLLVGRWERAPQRGDGLGPRPIYTLGFLFVCYGGDFQLKTSALLVTAGTCAGVPIGRHSVEGEQPAT